MKKIIETTAILYIMVTVLGGCGSENSTSLEDMQQSIVSGAENHGSGESDGKAVGSNNGNGTTGSQGQDGTLGSSQENTDAQESAGQGTDMKEADPDRAAMLECYITILEDIYFDQKFPGDQDYGYQPGESYDVASNWFAVYDVDMDGKEELLVTYTTTYVAGQGEIIYGYDNITGTVVEELRAYPVLTYFENGVVEELMSHNHGMAPDGDFWPYTLYQYDEEADCYHVIASVDAWSRAYREEDYNGNPFPENVDADGDGLVYYIMAGGDYILENPVDGAEHQNWRDFYMKNTRQIEVPYVNLTLENIYALEASE